MSSYCFLAQFSTESCQGRIVRAHLLPQQLLRREHPNNWRELAQDPRSWIYACGGITGASGHHGMLDQARTLRVPRSALPARTVAFAEYLGLGWYIDKEFGCDEGQEVPPTELVPRTAPTFDELYPEGR